MQKTFEQSREEAKANLIANARKGLKLEAGMTLYRGHYTFRIKTLGDRFCTVEVEFNGKKFRTVSIDYKLRHIKCLYGYEMTASLLTELCKTFVDWAVADAWSLAELYECRRVWFENNNGIGTRVRRAFPNPFNAMLKAIAKA